MNRRLLALVVFLLSSSMLFAAISFRGGESKLSLQEGKEEVVLSQGAFVQADSMSIESEKITLSGKDWRYIVCEGKTTIKDEERGLEVTTSYLWYDRVDELLIVSTWFQIEDKTEELSAEGGSLRYDMKKELLTISMKVTLKKVSDGEIMKCNAEAVTYDRDKGKVLLRGGAKADWKGDRYEAEAISIDLEEDTIQLEGRIRGTING